MSASSYISVPTSLSKGRNINGYSDEGYALKEAFHKDGVAFLRKLARALGLPVGSYEVRSNKGGMAVSGEVTLHGEDIYIQLSESCMGPGVRAMYRTCDGRTDYCGHQNRYASMSDFQGTENQARLVAQLRALVAGQRAKRESATC